MPDLQPVQQRAAHGDGGNEDHAAPLQVPLKGRHGVVDFLPRPDQVDGHGPAPEHGEDVHRQPPLAHAEARLGAVGGGQRPFLQEPLAQQGNRHQQVGHVDQHDADAGQDGEDGRLHHVDEKREHGQDADDDRGHSGGPANRVHLAELAAEGQVVVTCHGEHHADGCGVHGQGADHHGYHDADQECLPERAAKDAEDDVLESSVGCTYLGVVQVRCGEDAEQQDPSTQDERRRDRTDDGLWCRLLGVFCLLAQ